MDITGKTFIDFRLHVRVDAAGLENGMKKQSLITSIANFVALAMLCSCSIAAAEEKYQLRIQTHHAPKTVSGELVAQFIDDVKVMSGGRLTIEMFYSSSVVKSVETFDAASTGILDGDMTGAGYQIAKNPAFQFMADLMGGYESAWQQYAWLYNGGMEAADRLYGQYDMKMIGWWIYGQESFASNKPLSGPSDLVNWTFRSPAGLEAEILASMGAKPVVMNFTRVFSALENRSLDGADASGLANNVELGLYDIVDHATFPGFHSMPSDHLAVNREKWDSLPDDLKRIVEVSMQKLAFQTALTYEVKNGEAAAQLREDGVKLHFWSPDDRREFRSAALGVWQDWGEKSPESRFLVNSHIAFLRRLGLTD